jgi:hypothetical protein
MKNFMERDFLNSSKDWFKIKDYKRIENPKYVVYSRI